MAEIPRGAQFIDLILPAGGAAALEGLQTRLDVMGASDWRVVFDDGTLEQSLAPSQPMRGAGDRVWVVRQAPWHPSEPVQAGASLAVELAIESGATLAAFGIYGTYAWGLILARKVSDLYGLILLDWLYNPQISDTGELLEEPPADGQATLLRKLDVFRELWVAERAQAFEQRLPPGALSDMEGYKVLALLSPEGGFDPRFWQSFALQMALPDVQQASGNLGDEAADQPVPEPEPEPEPQDEDPLAGLSPLARAQLEAERKAADKAREEAARPAPVEPEDAGGPGISWHEGPRGPVMFMPRERYDAALIRSLQGGSTAGLRGADRTDSQLFERWWRGGGAFVTEVPSFARLFLDNVPLHKQAFLDKAAEVDGKPTLRCHLPRVCRVRAVLDEGAAGRRIRVSSDLELAPEFLLNLA